MIVARLRRTSDGLERDYVEPPTELATPESTEFMWTEGNYSCDCNRQLFFVRAAGEPEPSQPTRCGEERFTLVSLQFDGQPLRTTD